MESRSTLPAASPRVKAAAAPWIALPPAAPAAARSALAKSMPVQPEISASAPGPLA